MKKKINIKIPFGYPIVDKNEILAVKKVLKGYIFAHGPQIKMFENEFARFTNSPIAISVTSCTAGMHLAYFALGIGSGDEVIVSSQTHVATAHAIELVGAKPVFVDSDKITGNIEIDKIEKKITKKTKAISIVHFLGLPTDMIKVKKIAKKYKLYIIEDCALSLGAKINGTHTGLFGDVGVFSFYPVKHITTGEGGMIILKNRKLANKIKLIRGLGVDKSFNERLIPGVYDAVSLGLNYRMNEFQAAIGRCQLKKLNSFLKKRKKNFIKLSNLLKKINEIKVLPGEVGKLKGSFYCLSIILNNNLNKSRRKIINYLNNSGIGTSIYYPQPVPRMKYYKKKYGYVSGHFKNSEIFSDNTIALPVGPHLKKNDHKFIYEKIVNAIKKFN